MPVINDFVAEGVETFLVDLSSPNNALIADAQGVETLINDDFDATLPVVSITTPTNRSFVTTVPSIAGTAIDNSGGSGIARVEVFLKRGVDGRYRNGSVWSTTAPVALSTTLGSGTWSKTTQLPTASATDINKRLTAGAYFIVATAYDKAGNRRSASSSFTVQVATPASSRVVASDAPAAPSISVVVLSSASASADTASATLVFSGALDEASATELGAYVVKVNGVVVTLESVSGAGNGTRVTLVLAEGALHPGDHLEVRYDLRDARSRAVVGSVDLVAGPKQTKAASASSA